MKNLKTLLALVAVIGISAAALAVTPTMSANGKLTAADIAHSSFAVSTAAKPGATGTSTTFMFSDATKYSWVAAAGTPTPADAPTSADLTVNSNVKVTYSTDAKGTNLALSVAIAAADATSAPAPAPAPAD